jgi:hypothetical protein
MNCFYDRIDLKVALVGDMKPPTRKIVHHSLSLQPKDVIRLRSEISAFTNLVGGCDSENTIRCRHRCFGTFK